MYSVSLVQTGKVFFFTKNACYAAILWDCTSGRVETFWWVPKDFLTKQWSLINAEITISNLLTSFGPNTKPLRLGFKIPDGDIILWPSWITSINSNIAEVILTAPNVMYKSGPEKSDHLYDSNYVSVTFLSDTTYFRHTIDKNSTLCWRFPETVTDDDPRYHTSNRAKVHLSNVANENNTTTTVDTKGVLFIKFDQVQSK